MRALVIAASLAFALIACGSSGGEPADGTVTFPRQALTKVTSESGAATIEVRVAQQPPVRGVNAVELMITNAGGQPIPGLTLTIVPWMSSHGHGSSTTPEIAEAGEGRYVATGVNLFMPGRWDLRITLSHTSSGEATDRATATLDVP